MTRSDKINSAGLDGPQPANYSFLAMTQRHLGQPAAARVTLARLRETLQQDARWIDPGVRTPLGMKSCKAQ